MNELRIYPDPVLRDKARRVENFDSEKLHYITKIMENIIKEREAIGLAAPQVGVLEQIIVADSINWYISLINPEIMEFKGEDIMGEGCLSLPGVEVEIHRPNFVVIKGFDVYGEEKIIEATNLLARALQHEIDHLNGVLIVDKLSPLERIKFDMQWNPDRVGIPAPKRF